MKKLAFITVILIFFQFVSLIGIAANNDPPFTEEEFMHILFEADTVMSFYIKPEYNGSPEMVKLISVVGGGFDFYGTEKVDGKMRTRLTGGLARPKAYKAFLDQYFTDDVISTCSPKGTYFDLENDQVFWFAEAHSETRVDRADTDYFITEFTNEQIVCRITVTVKISETDYSKFFDYVYRNIAGNWRFTEFMTKKDLVAKLYSEVVTAEEDSSLSSSAETDQTGSDEHRSQTTNRSSGGLALIILAGLVFAAAGVKHTIKDPAKRRGVVCLLAACVFLVNCVSCTHGRADSPSDNISDKTPDNVISTDIVTSVPETDPTELPARSTDVPPGELQTEGDWQYVVNYSSISKKEEVTLKKYLGNDTCVTLPGKVGGLTIVNLSADAFSEAENAEHITEIVNVDNVLIKKGALAPLTRLESLTVAELDSYEKLCTAYFGNGSDDRLKTIGITRSSSVPSKCFANVSSLERVKIFSNEISIGEGAFMNCSGLKEISLGNTIKIGDKAFYGCESLEEIVLPDTLSVIGEQVFSGCSNLRKIRIETGKLDYTGSKGLGKLPSLKNIEFADAVSEIPAYLFYDSGLEGNLAILGSGIKSIGRSSFEGNWKMSGITIPVTVEKIDKLAFRYCMSLEKIDLPEGLNTISEGAFQHCCELKTVRIPNSAVSVGAWAFSFCDRLQSISIPDHITELPEALFYGCADLKTFSHNCSRVGDKAFFLCTGLENCDVGVDAELGDKVFYYCWQLYPEEDYSLYELIGG